MTTAAAEKRMGAALLKLLPTLDWTRLWPWGVYILACVVGVFFVFWRGHVAVARPLVVFTATRPLTANSRIWAKDIALKPPLGAAPAPDSKTIGDARKALVDHYLKSKVGKGDVIAPVAVLPAADLAPASDRLVIGLPIKNLTTGQGLDAGTPVIVCSGDDHVGAPSYRLRAVVCDTKTCTAYIEVSPTENAGTALLQGGLPPRVETATCRQASPAPAQAPATAATAKPPG